MGHCLSVKGSNSAVKTQGYLIFSVLLGLAVCKNDRCSNIKETTCYSVLDKKEVAPKGTCTRRADKVAHELYLDETTGKKFYLGFFGQLNWCEAHRFCGNHGMQLMSINDSRVSDTLVKILSSYGGHDFKIWVDVYKNPNSNNWVVVKNDGVFSNKQIQTENGWLTWAVVDQWHLTLDKGSFQKEFFDYTPFFNNWTDSGLEDERWPISKMKRPTAEDLSRKNLSGIISQIPTDGKTFDEIWGNFNSSSVIDGPFVLLDEPIDQGIESSDKDVRDDIVFKNLEEVSAESGEIYKDKNTGHYSPKIVVNSEGKDLNCASVGIKNQAINVQAEHCSRLNYFICQVV